MKLTRGQIEAELNCCQLARAGGSEGHDFYIALCDLALSALAMQEHKHGFDTMGRIFHSWLCWDKHDRQTQNLITEDGTAIMSLPVPEWPNHRCVAAWRDICLETAVTLGVDEMRPLPDFYPAGMFDRSKETEPRP